MITHVPSCSTLCLSRGKYSVDGSGRLGQAIAQQRAVGPAVSGVPLANSRRKESFMRKLVVAFLGAAAIILVVAVTVGPVAAAETAATYFPYD